MADLGWDPARLGTFGWLGPYLVVPGDASPPLAMTPPPDDAVGSYGADAVAWIERTQRIKLRWWQALAITRQLEHREDGSLCHRVVLESAPRRAGKSVRVRGIALWRMAHPDLFGEVQTVIHTGSDVAICREIQRGAWRWSEEVAGWTVSRSNGKEAVETPTGDRWLVRAQQAVYGYDCCFGIVDEGWNVSPDTVSEGLEPATLERLSPQLHLTSTAHRRATSLMRSRLRVALAGEDKDLLLLWAAPAGSDPGDPAVWRAASPHWSEDRRRMIADKYAKALAGKADPQVDDPDPMAGFTAQYLNIWPLREAPDTAIDPQRWQACLDPGELAGARSRLVLFVELAHNEQHATALAAAVLRDGRVRIEAVKEWTGSTAATQLELDLPGLVEMIRPQTVGWFPYGPTAAVAARLADRRKEGVRGWPPPGVTITEIRGEIAAACMGLAKEVAAGTLAHSGQPGLDDQVTGAEWQRRGDTRVFARKGGMPVDAVIGAAGAVHLARTLPTPVGKPRIISGRRKPEES